MSYVATHTGHCFCGAVTYSYDPPVKWMAHCHCESCRRATSSAFTSYFCVRDGQWQWTGAKPQTYESSPDVWRDFCPTCGSSMAYRAKRYPGEIHFHAATLTADTHFIPTIHVHADEAVDWVQLGDNLRRKSR